MKIQVVHRDLGSYADQHRDQLTLALRNLGHEAEITDDEPVQSGFDSLLFVGNTNWYPQLLRQLRRLPKRQRPSVVVWHYEPLPPPRSAGVHWPLLTPRELAKILIRDHRITDVYSNYWTIHNLYREGIVDRFVMTTRGRQDFLAERGIDSDWIPMGYMPHHGRPLGLDRDIDVLFLGALNIPRRKRILNKLKSMGLAVDARGDWHDPDCWGESRTRLINRAKVLLNFPRTKGETSGVRFVLGMCNQALVISEEIYRPDPYVPGVHFLSAPIDKIPQLVKNYLDNDGARKAITKSAWEHLTSTNTVEVTANSLVCILESLTT